jgi:hypothetical protein
MSKVVAPGVQVLRVTAEKPECELDKVITERGCADGIVLLVDFALHEYWGEQKSSIALAALFYVRRDAIKLGVFPAHILASDLPALNATNIDSWLSGLDYPIFDLNAALRLQSIAIPKPWGQEIWYTGIEKRGVAEVGVADKKIPLPWLLAAAPRRLGIGAGVEPILLKILDPLPEPVFGDLYFELHQQKQEVYVVTAVDKRAWPDGQGAIRFGFDPVLRASYSNDQRFLADYFAAVRDYRRVRVEVDKLLDLIRGREGVELNAPVTAATLHDWLREMPVELSREEEVLRAAMERFTRLLPLEVGDVVTVPCLLPHSLQHGVRTVEFQTPVYERLILSFGQKVLTQADWDTEASAALVQLDPPTPLPLPVTGRGEGWIEEQIVSFDNFEVRRVTLKPGACRDLSVDRDYGLGIVVGGDLQLGAQIYAPDEGVWLPGGLCAMLENAGAESAYFLLALPLRG